MSLAREGVVSQFKQYLADGKLAHSYLIVSRDALALADTARAVQKQIDGEFRFNLADGLVIEPDGASIGIDAVRDIREHLGSFPGIATHRTALVLQAELLTTEAQNALLKVAEEPAPQSVVILAVGDEERILPTLRSRLQRVVVTPASDDFIADWLATEHQLDPTEAQTLARRSAGSHSLALELLQGTSARTYAEQLINASPSQIGPIAKSAAADEVSLQELLRALSVALAYTEHTPRMRELWHRTQRLIAASQLSPLNLRLQIAALFSDLPL